MRRRWLAGGLGIIVLVTAIAAGVGAYQGSRTGLLARKGRLIAAETNPAGEDAISTLWTLTLRSTSGLEVQALLRRPRGPGPHPAGVLLGGIKRGRRVAAVDGLQRIASHAIVVAADYPLDQRRRAWQGWALVPTAARIRPAAFDTVAGVMLLVDYLLTRPDVAGDRVFLVGSSLGAPAVTIAGGIDDRPAAVVALYGGGRPGSLIAHTLQHADHDPRQGWQAWLMGHGLACLIAPLAPERYAPGIAPRPFLMVNGASDALMPRANVLALYQAAGAPKDLIWVDGDHVQPSETELIRRLSGTIVDWLVARGLMPPASSAGFGA